MIEIIEAVALGLGVFVAIEWSARNSHAQAISLLKEWAHLKQSPTISLNPKSDYRASGCGSCLLAWQKTMGMIAINLGLVTFLLSSLPQKKVNTMTIRMRKNINVAAVKVPICDSCWEGYHTACEGNGCACQWTHDFEVEKP